LVNAHETSTGVLHDIAMVGQVCRRANWVLVVDAISSFLADPYRMEDWNVGITILSTQKGLALPPGFSILVVRQDVAARMRAMPVRSLYFKLDSYFDDMQRGQTPFTPAVGILLQLHARLEQIAQQGVGSHMDRTAALAQDFRSRIAALPFTIPSERLSNAVTPLQPTEKISAYEVYTHLKEKYRLVVCPNGGELRDRLFRVGHLGHLSIDDNKKLIDALSRMRAGGLL
jgi:aspartate aminotransferase-like enzyme